MWPHNAQLGAISPNRKLHPLWLSALDPTDDYLRALAMPEHTFDGYSHERNRLPAETAAAAAAVPFDAAGIRVETTCGGRTEWQYDELHADYFARGRPRGHLFENIDYFADETYTVFVNDVPMGSYDTLDAANAHAAALAVYGRAHRVDTSRLS